MNASLQASRRARRALLHALVATLAIACAATAHAAQRPIYVLTTDNRIATVPEEQPGLATSAIAVTGLVAGDTLMAIDVRPQNGRLYGLGYNAAAVIPGGGTGTVQLYLIAVEGTVARASPIGFIGTFVNAVGTNVSIVATAFGMDFNPAADRLRVNNNAGQNFRMNPNTGGFVDGDLGGAAGSVAGMNMDGMINGGTVTADDAAYSNNQPNTTITTLYTIDGATNALWIQNPPNAGTQTTPTVVTLGAVPLDFTAEGGIDIPFGVNAPAPNAPAVGEAFAALSVSGTSSLYRIDLVTGAATLVGSFGLIARDIAFTPELAPVNWINGFGTTLLRSRISTLGTATTVAFTGVTAGERVVGIDGRPATGQLFGLGVNPVSNTGTLYLIDPQTGAALVVGTTSQIAFVDAIGSAVDLPDASWGFDFNPAVDRIRVISSTGVSFRLNPNTGAPVDGDFGGAAGSVAGINPDGAINGAVSIGIGGAAYSNNFVGTTVTTLYTLDPSGNRLFIQNPPNLGTQTATKIVTSNGVPFDFDTVTGFDIPPGVNAPSSNAEATGAGFAAMTAAGVLSLYRIDLPTAAVQSLGTIATGTGNVEGLVVWNAPVDAIFKDSFE